tara:strand:+ start:136 stop:1494 length:1359 start_codon:yes stop_codon:yes gene_type:complete
MKPNIIFISVDSLRADRCFGVNRNAKTPNLDSLIKNGVYFSQAISAADQTGTSLSSVFTGLFPNRTGQNQINFKSNIETYFDFLKKSNYHIYSLIPDITFFREATINFGDKTLYVFEDRKKLQRLEDNLGNKIIDKLKSKKMEEPWIYFIHLMDIHTPFSVPDEFDKKENGETKYDRLVSYVDVWLGKILNHINMKNTLVVITADHGEYIPVTGESITEIPRIQHMLTKGQTSFSFIEKMRMKTLLNLRFAAQTYRKEKLRRTLTPYEMRSFNTRSSLDLYDEVVRVPLIFAGYSINKGKIISDLVRNVDIFPTIIDMIGLTDSIKPDGRSLLPLINGKKLDELPAYIEVGINLAQLVNSKNPTALSKIIGIRTSEYKYLRARDDSNKNTRLFDLKNDPLEEKNIAGERIDVVKTMEEILTQFMKYSNMDGEVLSDEEIKKAKETLLRLGYI